MKQKFKGTLFANPANVTVRHNTSNNCKRELCKWPKALSVPANFIIEDLETGELIIEVREVK